MKNILSAFLLYVLVALLAVLYGPVPAGVALVVGSAALMRPEWSPGLMTVTLTPTILLNRTIRSVFLRVPALRLFAHEFTTERVRKDQAVVGKIRLRPTVADYDANNGGYEAGSQNARDLLVDVPFVMDMHKHITVKMSHLHAMVDSMKKAEEFIEDSASVLGAEVTRYVLGKVNSRSFSNGSTYTEANSNKDMTNAVRKALNLRGVADTGRFGLINSNVAEAIANDARVGNRYDDNSKDTDSSAYLRFTNLSGFESITEDPGLGSGNTTAVAVTGAEATDVLSATAHGFLENDRVNFPTLTGGAGLTASTGYYYVIASGLTADAFKVSATRGGAAVNFTTDISAGTVRKADNITGFFGSREAVAIKTALPEDGLEFADMLGIPRQARTEIITDPDSGLSALAYYWNKSGVFDTYVTLAILYGATAGQLADAGKYAMEPAGQILRAA